MASILPPTKALTFQQLSFGSYRPLLPGNVSFMKSSPSIKVIVSSASVETLQPSSSEDLKDGSSDDDKMENIEDGDRVFRGCKTCGKEDIEKGCNGEGRVQGGIGAVPGFGWWPIKAFRPCPAFLASGGRYKRQGQSMDEVAFGRSYTEPSSEKPSRLMQAKEAERAEIKRIN